MRVPAVAVLTVAGLALRVVCARQSVFGDELFTYEVATRGSLGDVLDGVRSPLEITPPLFFVFSWASAKLADPTFMLRLPSLVAGVALIPLVYALGARTVGRTAALAGAALMALAPFAVFYSAEARAYTLATFFACASTLVLLVALERRRRVWWVAFAALVAAAMYAHYTVAFVLAAQLAWALWAHREALRPLLLAHAGAALAFAPWIPEIQDDRESGFQTAIENVWPFTLEFFGKTLVTFFAGHPAVGLRSVPGDAGLVLLGVAAVAAAAGMVAARERLRRDPGPRLPRPEPRLLLMVALALATPLGAALYSLVAPSIYVPRTLLVSLPALCLVLGAVAVSLPRPFALAFVASLLAACVVGTAHVVTDERRPGYRAAAMAIDRYTRDNVVFENVQFDYGMLEVHLERPFRLYRAGCERAIREPGEVLTARVHCAADPAATLRSARAAMNAAGEGPLYVVVPAGPPPELPGWRVEEIETFGGFDELQMARLAPSGRGE